MFHTAVYVHERHEGHNFMARDTSPIVKQSRREGVALHPKAHKIMARKSGIPGEHAGGRQGKQSMYATQLREKQKVRRMYGLLEKQFAKLMDEATRKPGLSGDFDSITPFIAQDLPLAVVLLVSSSVTDTSC